MKLSSGIKSGSAGRKGRGVFATRNFKINDIVEQAPVILIPPDDPMLRIKNEIAQYLYETEDGRSALALGLASLYNHSYSANADFYVDVKSKKITIRASRYIRSGTEITINYNGDPTDKTKIDFGRWPF